VEGSIVLRRNVRQRNRICLTGMKGGEKALRVLSMKLPEVLMEKQKNKANKRIFGRAPDRE